MNKKEKFTNGTWYVYFSKQCSYILDEDECEICRTAYRLYNREQTANGHLIATAPKMYRAIKHILDSGSISDALLKTELKKLLAEARGE